jgi:hypothetical protein
MSFWSVVGPAFIVWIVVRKAQLLHGDGELSGETTCMASRRSIFSAFPPPEGPLRDAEPYG